MRCSRCGCGISGCKDVHKANLNTIQDIQDTLDSAIDVIKMVAAKENGYAKTAQAWLDDWCDPTPWCHICSARSPLDCNCPPRADND